MALALVRVVNGGIISQVLGSTVIMGQLALGQNWGECVILLHPLNNLNSWQMFLLSRDAPFMSMHVEAHVVA